MSDDPHTGPAPRARAVADAPLDALIADAEGLARRWLIALINVRPLERIGEIPLEVFALQAPPLCALAVRSLGSDAELERMTGRGSAGGHEDSTPARTLRSIAGALGGPAAVEAVEALRGVLWDALLGELHWPIADRSPVRLVADLADRLAYVCASVLAASLAQDAAAPADEFEVLTARRGEAVDELDRPPLGARVVLIDERGDAPARRPATSPTPRAHSFDDRVSERGGSEGAGGGGQAVRRAASPGSWSDGVPPIDRPEESRASATPPTTARPLPWDTPLRADRSDEAASAFGEGRTRGGGEEETGDGGAGAAGHPAMRVTRRTTPVDGAA